jgi:hypothetical protein
MTTEPPFTTFPPCRWCGMDQGHSEVCEGFDVNDPGRRAEPPFCPQCGGFGVAAPVGPYTCSAPCPRCGGGGRLRKESRRG